MVYQQAERHHAEVMQALAGKEAPQEPVMRKYGKLLLAHMQPGKLYIAEDFMEMLKSKGLERTPEQINISLSKLVIDKLARRVRQGIYALPEAMTDAPVN